MRVAAAVWAVAVSAALAGCGPAVSVRPLYTDADREKPVAEPRIEGDWISGEFDKDTHEFTVDLGWKISAVDVRQPDGHYSLTIRSLKPSKEWNGATSATLTINLVSIDDTLFFDATASPADDEYWPIMLGVVPMHLVGRLWVEQTFLRFAVLDDEWAAKTVPVHLRGPRDQDFPTIFMGSTSKLRDLVRRNADNDKAFRHSGYVCRSETDCAALAARIEREHPR